MSSLFADRYELVEALGAGGAGTAWRAIDRVREQEVALKVVRGRDRALHESLRREFAALMGLAHPHLAQVFDFGHTRDGDSFYAARFVAGRSLDAFATGRSFEHVREALVDAVDALHFLHRLGLRHGDVKPANVIVGDDGRGTLIDLGCAAPLGPSTHHVSGTPGYLAPEIFDPSAAIDARADLYALGVTMKALELPEALRALRERLLSPDPAGRPADAAEVLEALGAPERALAPLPIDAPRILGRERIVERFRSVLDQFLARSDPDPDSASDSASDSDSDSDSDLSPEPAPEPEPGSFFEADPRSRNGDRDGGRRGIGHGHGHADGDARGPAGDRVARVWILRGDEGSGRTRLLNELTWIAQLRTRVIVGRASAGGFESILERGLGVEASGVDAVLEARERMHSVPAKPEGKTETPQPSARSRLGHAETGGSSERQVWILDDADQLDAGGRRALEAWIRETHADDSVFLVVAGDLAPRGAAEVVDVDPLDREAVATWASGRADPVRLHALTGGHAATVRSTLAAVASGASLDDLGAAGLDATRARDVSLEAQHALALLALFAGGAESATLNAAAASDAALAECIGRGWAIANGSERCLARRVLGPAILDTLPPTVVAAAHRSIVHALANEPATRAIRARSLAALGDTDAALEALADLSSLDRTSLRAAASELARSADPELALRAAEIYAELGAAQQAKATLERFLPVREAGGAAADPRPSPRPAVTPISHPPDRATKARIHLELARASVKLEDADDAFAHIAEVLALSRDEAERASAAHLRAHLLLKRGRYEEALASAVGDAPALDEDRGIALSYLGRHGEADAAFERAEPRVVAARDRVRVVSYRAINDYRRGELDRAGERYRAALALAEEHGLEDLVASCALNLGSVEHQRGELGRALASYTRGQRIASALGQSTALATLELDLAKLYADAGSFDRARTWIERATARAAAHDLAFLAAACASVRGEIELGEERWDEAEAALDSALRAFEATNTARERREVELTLARLDRSRGRLDAARARLVSTANDPPDLAMRTALEIGLLELEAQDAHAARASLDRAIELASTARQPLWTAQALAARARAWRVLGATTLAETDRASARAAYERIAAGLPAALRDAFWRHPDRTGLEAPASTSTPERERRLEQLLAINKKLGASLDVPDVLRSAMDAAIDLTGAERGFVLLEKGGELSVEIARNLDREKIGRSHLKFSRTIAEQVVASGEPVITVDALADARFRSNESVHAMKLRSVIAVPIPSPEGAIGALYLDNRFQRGRFERVDTDTLLAFADQVAIALANARLHDELRRRTEELESERARVLALSQGQAVQIEELQGRLRQQQRSLEHRYDYGALVARSPAMQPAISMLDRVIETPLTILVTGESGTGKELVARAAHFSSPRREGPFVSVNCAALPDALLESELFGHVRGAFTGAERDREGLMVAAQNGTLFLDEIGETTLAMQAKLLRAIEERQVRAVGASSSRPVDFRLVCATNRDLRLEAEAGRFREDLYYRIGVIEVRLPPLRERGEDLPELTERLLAGAAASLHRDPPRVSARAMRELMRQSWPGNVRELQNALAAALVLCDGDTLEPEHLRFQKPRSAAPIKSRAERDERERARIMDALGATDWNASRAARQVGLSRATFYRKLAKYGVLRTRT